MSSTDGRKTVSEPIARTVKEFCRAYGIGKTLAYELIAEGRIVAVRAGPLRTVLNLIRRDIDRRTNELGRDRRIQAKSLQ